VTTCRASRVRTWACASLRPPCGEDLVSKYKGLAPGEVPLSSTTRQRFSTLAGGWPARPLAPSSAADRLSAHDDAYAAARAGESRNRAGRPTTIRLRFRPGAAPRSSTPYANASPTSAEAKPLRRAASRTRGLQRIAQGLSTPRIVVSGRGASAGREPQLFGAQPRPSFPRRWRAECLERPGDGECAGEEIAGSGG
jgi:hypothetical protein